MYLQVLYYLHLLLCESIRIQVNVVLQLLKFTNGKNHKFNKEVSAPNIAIDYRTNFSYWNFDNNQNHASGDLKANTSTDAEMSLSSME